MPITRNGLKFIGSRTTGPSSHFLAVTFAKEQGPLRFVSLDGADKTPDPEKVAMAKTALAELAANIPVSGGYAPTEVGLTERDTANAFHYKAILADILSQAENELT